MKVKKFEAESMPKVMSQVKKEMGNDAVILNSKVVHRGGFLGLFKKKNIEVIAAIDPADKQPPRKQAWKMEKKKEAAAATSDNSLVSDQTVLSEIKALKKLVEKKQSVQPTGYPQPYQELYDHLVAQEITAELADGLLARLKANEEKVSVSIDGLKSIILDSLESKGTSCTFGGVDYSRQFVHFVGPTGVGKTTTIAKVAARAVLNDQKKVAFITTDTYRIAAIDQLKTYAKLLDVPIEVAYSLEDYMEARNKFTHYDLVLVDTAGRNFRDPQYVYELSKLIDFRTDMETYLVLSLTSRYKDMQAIFDQFSNIPIRKFIFTKSDETSTYGSALNLLLNNEVGAAYITNGQNVPDDIQTASAQWIASRIAGDRRDA
ncbi:flagellar biosynthesis protein FlhF [Halobacillus sp. MO56]